MKIFDWLRWILFLTITWLILQGTWDIITLLIGIFLSVLALAFTSKQLIGQPYHHMHSFSFIKYTLYTLFLIKEVYIAGFYMVLMIFNGRINPMIIEIETDLKEDYQRVILANSITLTPGTITVDLTDNKLKVLWINKTTNDPLEAKKIICESIEKRLEVL